MHDVFGLRCNFLVVCLVSVAIKGSHKCAKFGVSLVEIGLLIFHQSHEFLLFLFQVVALLIHAIEGFFGGAKKSPAFVVVLLIPKLILEALQNLVDPDVRRDFLLQLGDVIGG